MRINLFSYMQESLHEEVVTNIEQPVEQTHVQEPDGVALIEKEYVVYAKIEDQSVLNRAESFCIQEQWEVKIPKMFDNSAAGRIRLRKTISDEVISYVLTSKTKVAEGEKEVEITASEDMFNQFKLIATSGMHKKRYIFPIENTNLKWEVDVFIMPDGSTSDHVKIDLEVLEPLKSLPLLPAGFTDVITNQKSKLTDEERRKIQGLYDTVFLRKNEHLSV